MKVVSMIAISVAFVSLSCQVKAGIYPTSLTDPIPSGYLRQQSDLEATIQILLEQTNGNPELVIQFLLLVLEQMGYGGQYPQLPDQNNGNRELVIQFLLLLLEQMGYGGQYPQLPDQNNGNRELAIQFLLFFLEQMGYGGQYPQLPEVSAPGPELSNPVTDESYPSPSNWALPSQWNVPNQNTNGWGSSSGWRLSNSKVLTGGSASAGANVLAGGSVSADKGTFTKSKSESRSRGSSSVQIGMVGGDGGDNYNTVNGGISKSGGGIDNMLSKLSGTNNQGVNGQNDFWKYFGGANQDQSINNQEVNGMDEMYKRLQEGGYIIPQEG